MLFSSKFDYLNYIKNHCLKQTNSKFLNYQNRKFISDSDNLFKDLVHYDEKDRIMLKNFVNFNGQIKYSSIYKRNFSCNLFSYLYEFFTIEIKFFNFKIFGRGDQFKDIEI